MKINYSLLILTILFLNCTKDNVEEKTVIESISSKNTFIGDTLTIRGQNINLINSISIEQYKKDNSFYNPNIISRTNTEIKFVIPELYDESIRIYTGENNPTFDVEVHGYIPYSRRSYEDDNPFRNMKITQLVNDDVAFFIPESTFFISQIGGLVRFTENYDKPEVLNFFNNMEVVDCHFFSKDKGWIIVINMTVGGLIDNYHFYYTEDGGKTVTLKNTVSGIKFKNEYISNVTYVDENLGYISTSRFGYYRVNGTEIENINTIYPELTTKYNYADGEFENLKVLDNGVVLLYNSYDNANNKNIIRIENNTFTNFITENSAQNITFFKNKGFYNTNNKIFESNDYGLSWRQSTTSSDWSSNSEYQFLKIIDANQFLRRRYYQTNTMNYAKYEVSFDGGKTWKNCFGLPYENVRFLDFNENYGLTIGDRRYFKFRKFLN